MLHSSNEFNNFIVCQIINCNFLLQWLYFYSRPPTTFCKSVILPFRTSLCYLCAQLGHAGQLVTIGAFTLAGIRGIQILVFASRSKSWDFYKRGHKNLTNYRDQHRAANRNKSCDYLHRGGCVNARANNLGIFCPARARVIFRLDIRHAQFG